MRTRSPARRCAAFAGLLLAVLPACPPRASHGVAVGAPSPSVSGPELADAASAAPALAATEDARVPAAASGVGAVRDAGAAEAASAPSGACSAAHSGASCDDPAIAQCVCTMGDPNCCQSAWDTICVGLVQGLKCKGDCCHATGALGCAVAGVESCVCGLDNDCCTKGWDEFCTIVAQGKCNVCGGQ